MMFVAGHCYKRNNNSNDDENSRFAGQMSYFRLLFVTGLMNSEMSKSLQQKFPCNVLRVWLWLGQEVGTSIRTRADRVFLVLIPAKTGYLLCTNLDTVQVSWGRMRETKMVLESAEM